MLRVKRILTVRGEGIWGDEELFLILHMTVLTCLHALVKTQNCVLKWVSFTVCELYSKSESAKEKKKLSQIKGDTGNRTC